VYDNEGNNISDIINDHHDRLESEFKRIQLELDNKVHNVVSIKDYDVDPTGVEDSRDDFLQALNDLDDNDILQLEKNATYYLSDEVRINVGGKYKIEGNGSKILTNADNNKSGLYFSGVLKRELTPLTKITEG